MSEKDQPNSTSAPGGKANATKVAQATAASSIPPASATTESSKPAAGQPSPASADNTSDTSVNKLTTPGNAPNQTATNPGITFHSGSIGKETTTAKSKDYFAEQNAKSATKKQTQDARNRKIIIVASIIVGTLVVIGLVWGIIVILTSSQDNDDTAEVNAAITSETFDTAIEEAMNYDPRTEPGPTEENIEKATEIYTQAIESATNDNNATLVNELLVSQMLLYINTGKRYAEIIEIGEEVDPEALSEQNRRIYYNAMANAYDAIGNSEESSKYYEILFDMSGREMYGSGN